ncbi:MAG: hypothetical protein EBZ91_10915 [Gammaproteobacteria bacterium]|nr:hypothetical protein [Gammaproteobacteria bacterium]
MSRLELCSIPCVVEYGSQSVGLLLQRAIAANNAQCEHRAADHQTDDGDHHQHLDQRESRG